jgi:hypothetical protein
VDDVVVGEVDGAVEGAKGDVEQATIRTTSSTRPVLWNVRQTT